jgi:hypothetical protein
MPMLAVPKMSSEAVSSCDARFQIPGFAVPGAYFSPVTSPALNAQSHQYAHQQSRNTTSRSSTGHSPIDIDMDMLGEPAMVPQEQGRRSLRSTNKRNVPRANANGRVRQSPIVKPNRRKAKEGSRFEEFDGGRLPEDGSLMTRSLRSTQKRKRSRPIVSDAVRQRNTHAQETPSVPDDTRAPVVRPPSDDKLEQEADRPRDNKIRRIRSTLDVGLEGAYSTLLQREKKRKQIFEIEEPIDPGDRDVVDVLLEQWTVPEH